MDNFLRADFHSARIKAVLTALREAKAAYAPIGFGTATAVAGEALGESYASVARSWKLAANQREQAEAEKLVATRGQAKATRIGHDAEDLARKVRAALETTLAMAVTEVAAETRYSPGWVSQCERQHRGAVAAVQPPHLTLVQGGGRKKAA